MSPEEADDDVQRAWAAEIDRRSRIAAKEPGEDWRVVLDEIRADINSNAPSFRRG
jgi:hypothetical protein